MHTSTKKSKTANDQNKQPRLLIIGAALVFLMACGIGGRLWYLQRQADAGNYSMESRQDPAIVQARREAAIAKARVLREKWQVWALQHKDELKRLKNAPAADQTALMAVWNAIPTRITATDGGIAGQELSSGAIPFTWQPMAKAQNQPNSDPKLQQTMTREKQYTAELLKTNFDSQQDIEISRSMMPVT